VPVQEVALESFENSDGDDDGGDGGGDDDDDGGADANVRTSVNENDDDVENGVNVLKSPGDFEYWRA